MRARMYLARQSHGPDYYRGPAKYALRPGRRKKGLYKLIFAIGLISGFLEP